MIEESLVWVIGGFIVLLVISRTLARYLGRLGFTRAVDTELERIVKSDEFKVKGRFE